MRPYNILLEVRNYNRYYPEQIKLPKYKKATQDKTSKKICFTNSYIENSACTK